MNTEQRIALARDGHFATLMAELDEPERDWAIENADNVIDMREHFEWEQMSRHVVVLVDWDYDPA